MESNGPDPLQFPAVLSPVSSGTGGPPHAGCILQAAGVATKLWPASSEKGRAGTRGVAALLLQAHSSSLSWRAHGQRSPDQL